MIKMPEPLKNKLRCAICNKLIESCKCVDSEGDKYESDIEQDLFIGYDVQLAVEWLKQEVHKCVTSGISGRIHAKIDKAFPDLNIGKNQIE